MTFFTILGHIVVGLCIFSGVCRASIGASRDSVPIVIHGCLWVAIGFAFLRLINL